MLRHPIVGRLLIGAFLGIVTVIVLQQSTTDPAGWSPPLKAAITKQEQTVLDKINARKSKLGLKDPNLVATRVYSNQTRGFPPWPVLLEYCPDAFASEESKKKQDIYCCSAKTEKLWLEAITCIENLTGTQKYPEKCFAEKKGS